MPAVLKQIEQIIEAEANTLDRGHAVTIMFDDGIATLLKENEGVAALIEEIPATLRIFGSVTDLRKR